ncbi:MAG TPA: hypothetical protein VF599_12630 [Pyrinomonadaceae bacterium]|jgi:hypothetical protein
MALREVEGLNLQSTVKLQDLANAGLNPFAVELLVESYRLMVERMEKLPEEITFAYCGVQISIKPYEALDWEKAFKHFFGRGKEYQANVFRPIAKRYEGGERTRQLYDEMMSVE